MTATGRQFWVDVSFPLGAALLYGIDPVLTGIGLAGGLSPEVAVAIRTVAAAGGFGLYLLVRSLRGERGLPGRRDRWLVLAGVANSVYLLAYYAAVARIPVATAAPLMGSSTLFVVAGAALFFRESERVTRRLAAAAGLVVAGVVGVVVVAGVVYGWP